MGFVPYPALPGPLAGFKGPTSKSNEGMRREGKGRKGLMGGKGKDK